MKINFYLFNLLPLFKVQFNLPHYWWASHILYTKMMGPKDKSDKLWQQVMHPISRKFNITTE